MAGFSEIFGEADRDGSSSLINSSSAPTRNARGSLFVA